MFGIRAHRGPQSAAEAGDWHARNMFIQGQRQYDYHVKTYGHTSKFGFKGVIATWKAEKSAPDHLIQLYTIKPLATTSSVAQTKIKHVELPGFKEKMNWTQDEKRLTVQMPEQKSSDHMTAFKIAIRVRPGCQTRAAISDKAWGRKL